MRSYRLMRAMQETLEHRSDTMTAENFLKSHKTHSDTQYAIGKGNRSSQHHHPPHTMH